MAKSARVRDQDVRAILKLISEAASLSYATGQREQCVLRGLCEIVGARAALMWRVERLAPELLPMRVVTVRQHGLTPSDFEAWVEHTVSDRLADPSELPLARYLDAQPGVEVVTVDRQQLLSDGDWYGDPHVKKVRRELDIDHFIRSARRLDQRGDVDMLGLHRSWRDDPFTKRDRKVVDLFWQESGWLFPQGPVPFGGWRRDPDSGEFIAVRELPPRLRQMLEGILKGENYAEIAAQLGISGHTVRDHIKRLYRVLKVTDRDQLRALYGQ